MACLLPLLVLALHYDVLTEPPAIEQARGLWLQAAYLADTQFDYHRLETEEPGPDTSGAYGYPRWQTSLPTALAAMMLALPSPQAAIIAYRLLTFLAAALVALLVYDIVQRQAGRTVGVLLVAALLTNPVFFVQTELLGMDLPLALTSVCVAWCLAVGRPWSAACFALASIAMKVTGAIAVLALVLSLRLEAQRSRKRRFITWALLFAAVALFYAVLGRTSEERLLWHDLRKVIHLVSPDLVVLAGMVLALTALAFLRDRRVEEAGNSRAQNDARVQLYCWLFIAVLLVLADQMAFFVRYLTPAIPLLWIALAATRFRGAIAAVAIGLLAWNIANLDGRWLPDLDKRFARGAYGLPFLTERSREYLHDQQVRKRFVDAAAEHGRGHTLVTEYPYGYLLSVPRLGWVQEPVSGFSTFHGSKLYTRFRGFDFNSAPDSSLPPDSVFAFVQHPATFSYDGLRVLPEFPPAETGDDVFFDETHGQRYLVFVKHWQVPSPLSEEALRQWDVDRSFWGPDMLGSLELKVRFRLDVLRVLGMHNLALREFDAWLTSGNVNPELRSVFLEVLAYRFPVQLAWNYCYPYSRSLPKDAFARAICGIIALRGGDRPLSGEMFKQALAIDPNHVHALLGAAMLSLGTSEISAADVYLERAMAQPAPAHMRAQLFRWLGEVRLRQNRLEEAATCFESALALNGELAEARERLQVLQARRR